GGGPRRGLPLPHRAAGRLSAAAPLRRRPRPRRRRRREGRGHRAGAARLPPRRDGARLRRLLPELPRRRGAELGGARRARPGLGAGQLGGQGGPPAPAVRAAAAGGALTNAAGRGPDAPAGGASTAPGSGASAATEPRRSSGAAGAAPRFDLL